MRAARIVLISLTLVGGLAAPWAATASAADVPGQIPCYDVTVDVPPYHPGATVCPPSAELFPSSGNSGSVA